MKTVAGVVAALGVATLVALGASTTTRSTLRRATKDWFPNDGVLLAPAPSDLSPTVTFTLRTACKTTQLAEDRAAFFMDGEKEAYVVRHNYGTGEFFKNATKGPGKALKMERVTLDGEERGYRLTTNEVNFEFGFAIRNVETGEWLYEIGKSDSPLGKEKCTQKVRVFQSCAHERVGCVSSRVRVRFVQQYVRRDRRHGVHFQLRHRCTSSAPICEYGAWKQRIAR